VSHRAAKKCFHKTAKGNVFSDYGKAVAHAKAMMTAPNFVGHVRAYFCKFCGQFHVGSPFGKILVEKMPDDLKEWADLQLKLHTEYIGRARETEEGR
jgi:hypothetical protein